MKPTRAGAAFGLLLALASGADAQTLLQDADGHKWDIQADGSVSDGDNDTFDGGFRLQVNDTSFGGGGMQIRRGGREIVLGPWQTGDLRVTRKIYVPPKQSYARYVEIIENSGEKAVEVKLALHTNVGGTVVATSLSADGEPAAWAAISQGVGARNAFAQRVGHDRGSLRAEVVIDGENVFLKFVQPLRIGPGRRAAIVHVAVQAATLEAAADSVRKLRLESLVADLEIEDRRVLRDVGLEGILYVGDLELFRGELLDRILLTTGETITGSLETPSITLESDFGARTIPSGEILCLRRTRDRFRAALQGGEVITGRLREDLLRLKLENETELKIPIPGIDAYGRRLREEESRRIVEGGTHGKAAGPVFHLRKGDRLFGRLAQDRLRVRTIYGVMELPTDRIHRLELAAEGERIPRFTLKDGSEFAGFLEDIQVEVIPHAGPALSIPFGRIAAIAFVPDSDPSDDAAAGYAHGKRSRLRTVNGDLLYGRLLGEDGVFVLDTPFGDQNVGATQIKRLQFDGPDYRSARVTFWDGTTLPARMPGEALAFETSWGAKLSVPYGEVRRYLAPGALPPERILREADALVEQLGAPDVELREKAGKELIRRGPGIRGVLIRHLETADPEILERVRWILKSLDEAAGKEEEE